MGEIIPTFILEESLTRTRSLLAEVVKQSRGHDGELNRLQGSVDMVRDFLQDAEKKTMEKVSVRHWLMQLKNWAHDAEDVLDDLAYELLRQKVKIQYQAEANMRNCLRFSKGTHFVQKTAFRINLAYKKVKNVNESLDKIKNDAFGFELVRKTAETRPQIIWKQARNSIINDHFVVPREDEVSEIVNLLAVSRTRRGLTVVSIVGLPGIGKTTVAKLVCQKAMEDKLFDFNTWTSVSTDFESQRILGEMLQTVDRSGEEKTNEEAIIQCLQDELQTKSFLLVLEDAWIDQELSSWESLRRCLSSFSNNNGNAVVVTTRSKLTASRMETWPVCRHNLKLLSPTECWSIISRRVSANNEETIPLELVDIGMEIAKKCGGLPLAAMVLGGTMRANMGRGEWLEIKENSNILNVKEDKVSIEAILRLSFDRLPSHLKPCFAYCSMFPRSIYIAKMDLITLWMAQGLLESPMEETGEKYVEQLIFSSFLREECDEFGNITFVWMHDLLHDLAISISKFDKLTWETGSHGDDFSNIKHLNLNVSYDCWSAINIYEPGSSAEKFPKDRANKLHSLFTANAQVFYDSWKLESLRILKLMGNDVKELPSSIGKLKHLRHLDVSNSEIREFPESLTKLYNLQTLRLFECKSLGKLPKTLRNLVSLRHLLFSYEKQMPTEVGRLTNLQSLSFFVVGPEGGGSIQELECLNELSGELMISNLEMVSGEEEAKKANLQSKRKIEGLQLVWTADNQRQSSYCNHEQVLEGLQPFKDLKHLSIKNYLGKKFPSWLLKMGITGDGYFCTFNHLVELTLEGCSLCGEMPRLGHLPQLRNLEIIGLDNVRFLSDRFYGSNEESTGNELRLFSALNRLSLSFMNNLVEWMAPTTWNAFPCLEELQIFSCPKLRSIPITHISSLVKLAIQECDELSELSFDQGHPITSLRLLKIESCCNLASIQGFQGLTSLKQLEISNCDKLTNFSKEHLYNNLHDDRILFQNEKMSFWLEKWSGKRCYMISARDMMINLGNDTQYWRWNSDRNSRFGESAELVSVCWLEISGKIDTYMLSTTTLYGAYLLFKLSEDSRGIGEHPIKVGVGLADRVTKCSVHLDPKNIVRDGVAKERRDGWLEIELGDFFNTDGGDGDLEMSFMEVEHLHMKRGLIVQGIEIRPKSP